ncbi:MAG: PAS domain S-box protein [Leptolyngbya sp. BL-A-14]
MKILVVEDETIVAQTLKLLLSNFNYSVDMAADGEAGLQMANAFEYDLILLDVGLPKLDGISLCKRLRNKGFQTPILLLTGQGGGSQKAIALNAGADDYVVKPFDSEELIARVQALLRRGDLTNQPILTWGNLSLDPSRRQVAYATHQLSLTPKEYAILELFLRNSQRVFSAGSILEHAWNSVDSPGEEAVRVHIKELRHKLKAMGAPKNLIKTVYGTGYQLNPLYSSEVAAQAEGSLTVPQSAELQAMNEALRNTLKELRQQNEALELKHNAVEQERQRYLDLFEFAPDGYLVTDCQGRIQAANRAAVALLGVESCGSHHLLEQSLMNFVAKADLVAFHTRLEGLRLGQSDREPSWQVTLQPRRGEPIPVLVAVSAIQDQQRQTTGLRWLLRDVQQRQQMEQRLQSAHSHLEGQMADHTAERLQINDQLQTQQHRWQALFEHALDAIVIVDDERRFVDANPAACSLFGVSYEAFLHSTLADFADPTVDVEPFWQQFRQQGQIKGIFCLHRPDGSVCEAELTAIAHFIPDLHLAILRDMTDRKQLERALYSSQTKLRGILDSAFTAISSFRVFANQDWEYEYWSAGCEALFSYTEPELMADKRFWLSRVLPDDREAILMPLFHDFFATRTTTAEYRFRCKDDSVRWFSSTYTTQQIEADCWLVTAVNTDITARKQTETAVQQQLERAHLVAKMSRTIRQTLELESILQLTVDQVQQALQTDRIIIFRFQPNWEGIVVAEAVAPGWGALLGNKIHDDCFTDRYIEPYRQGRVSVIHDLETSGITPCYAEFLAHFQVKANLVVPIMQNHQSTEDCLWGLLIAHQCATVRQWQPEDIELLQQLSNQVGIAIQQAELYQQTRRELLERERTEAELRESEARYRLLFEHNPQPMWVYDLETLEFLTVNQAAIKHYGYAREEFLGMTIADIRPERDRERLRQVVDTIAFEQTYFGVWKHLKRDGSMIDVEVVAHAITFEGRQAALALINDITERLKTEQTIREQAALLDIASDAIFVRTLDHRILYWYQGAERIYGWRAADAIGQNAVELLQEEPNQVAVIVETLLHRGLWQGEMHKVTQAGQPITVEARWTLVYDDAGQPLAILVVSSDITQKKQLEAQFYHAQRLESLGTLTSGIAHDLNNVLTPILTIAQLIRMKEVTLNTEALQLVQILEDSAKRGASMVKQILTFTRGTAGDRKPMDVAPVIQEVITVIRQTFPKTIQIREDLGDSPLRLVSADSTHLHQVLMNLCVNARDAMPQGGVLTLTVQNCTVDALFAQMHLDARIGDYVLLTITDTGMGIAPAVRDRMFDPFFTTKALNQGTGLGLSTVLGIVKSYDGFLQVVSEVGKGTQMQVYLPAIEGQTLESHSTDLLPQGKGALILIVDDDHAVQRINRSLLEEHHYKTLAASDGIEAIAVYAQYQKDIKVVLLDVMMPNMDGITVVQTLKRMNPTVKILAISGLPSNQAAVLKAGANIFLAKPYTIEALLKKLDNLIKMG